MLTGEQWERIEGHLPGRDGLRGRSGVDNRQFVVPFNGWPVLQRAGVICRRCWASGAGFMRAPGAGRTPAFESGCCLPCCTRRTSDTF